MDNSSSFELSSETLEKTFDEYDQHPSLDCDKNSEPVERNYTEDEVRNPIKKIVHEFG